MVAVKQKILAVSGVKNSGKTTLLERLIPALKARGVQTAVIKHDGHSFAAEREGTDTWRMLRAGATGTAVYDGEKFQVVKYDTVTERDLVSLFPEAELILLEGFKGTDYPKIEIVRKGNSAAPVCKPETLIALVTDTDVRLEGVATFSLGEADTLTEHIIRWMKEDTQS